MTLRKRQFRMTNDNQKVLPLRINKNILWFQITVANVAHVHIAEGLENASSIETGLVTFKPWSITASDE
jgi:hypothetical protein